jgi:class 3 adenylate cyclase/tetratricopeptide (TPR) repeat protein
MADISSGLIPFVPSLVTSHIADLRNFPEHDVAENFISAALFADISGFTSITERLAERGPQGVEMLSSILNDYFGKLTSKIAEHGGDVVNFAGDSLLAIWKIPNASDTAGTLDAVLQCAHRIQTELQGYETGVSTKLSMRVGVGVGETRVFFLGSTDDTWKFLLAGESIEQAQFAEKIATPGDIICSPKVWELLNHLSDYRVETVQYGGAYLRLTHVPDTFMLERRQPPQLSEDLEKSLQGFVPSTVLTHLIAGQMDWLAELRRLTVVFINLKGFNGDTSLTHAGEVIRVIHETAAQFEGYINTIGMDEKGASPIMIFGAPPFAHEDDPVRGVMAAREVSRKLTALGQLHSIGITTGRAFCGVIGGVSRREYATIGDVINTAARLMQAAWGGEGRPILCDAVTQQAASQRVKFSQLELIHLKGKSEAVAAFRLLDEGDVSIRVRHDNPFVGRMSEKEFLRKAFVQVSKESARRIVILEGEAGIGKSRLLEYVQTLGNEIDGAVFICEADAVEKNTSYFSWRGVFRQLLGLEGAQEPVKRREQVLLRLPEEWRERASLLNPILGFDFDEPDFIKEMGGEIRAENIRAMLIDLLRSTNKTPMVILLEDAHWQDSASWALTLEVSRVIASLLVVIATRPLGEPLPSQYHSLFANKDTQHLILGPLSPGESLELVKQRLDVNALPDDVANLIKKKAEGNPFFSEELAYSLRDSGLIKIENSICRIVEGVDLKLFSFPDTVHGVVTSRIDRLPPQEQLCIKVASVIGRIFTYRLLHDIHPLENDRQYMASYLKELEKLDLTPLETVTPDLTYIFKHAITQDVAYNLMLFAQRQELHKSIAEWHESHFSDDLSTLYPALAHHWRFAGDREKALHYLELAAQQALDNFANHEAIDFLNLIVQIESQFPVNDYFRKARWERQLGQAYKGLGEMEMSRAHFQTALKWMGYPAPRNLAGWVFDLIGQLFRRMLIPARQVANDSKEARQIKEVVLSYESLSEIYYYAIDLPPFLACLLHLLNLVDRLGISQEMARAYSVTTLVAGLIPLHGIAKRYEKRAMAMMDTLGQFDGLAFAMSGLSLYNMGIGNFEQAFANMTRAVDSVTFLNNRPRMAEVFTTMAQVHQRFGNYAESMEYFDRAYQAGLREENPQHQVWGLNGKAGILLYQGGEGHAQQAISLLKQSIPLLVGSTDHTEDIRAYGMLGLAHLRLGHKDLAKRAADQGLHFISTISPTAHDALEGFAGVAETYLLLLGANHANTELSKLARASLKGLLKCGQLFPVAMPRYWCYMGLYSWLCGNKSRATAYWQKGLGVARKLDMKYEEARLLYEQGCHDGTLNGKTKLSRAAEYFRGLGSMYDLEKTLQLLATR